MKQAISGQPVMATQSDHIPFLVFVFLCPGFHNIYEVHLFQLCDPEEVALSFWVSVSSLMI